MEKILLGLCVSTRIVITQLASLKHIFTDVKKNKRDFQLSLGGTPLLYTLRKRHNQYIPINRFFSVRC